ncbi:hypothetical protein L218DRAFT_946532 [Marasmius fiardii PR-910]|nr:hypothetical protein L218DRAFT_946532 [Marasmius fiardii PR-910]
MNRLDPDIILYLVLWVRNLYFPLMIFRSLRGNSNPFVLSADFLNLITEETFWATLKIKLITPASAKKIRHLVLKIAVINPHVQDKEGYLRIKEVLPEAISKLKGLRSVNWSNPDSNEMIIQSLAALPLLSKGTHGSFLAFQELACEGMEWNVFEGLKELRWLRVNLYLEDTEATTDPEQHIVGTLVKKVMTLPKIQKLLLQPTYERRGEPEGSPTPYASWVAIREGVAKMEHVLRRTKLKLLEALSVEVCPLGVKWTYVPEMVGPGEVMLNAIKK